MQSTSTTYNNLLNNINHRKEVKVVVGGTTYGEDKIISLKTEADLFPNNTLSFGGCVSRSIELSFYPTGNIPRMALIEPYVRLTNGTTSSEWLPKGKFYIDTRRIDPNTGIVTLTGYDSMLKTEQDMIPEGQVPTDYPKSMRSVVSDIASRIGVSLDSRNSISTSYMVQLPTSYTMRDVLGYIAGVHCGNFTISDTGALRLVRVSSTVGSATLNQSCKSFENSGVFGSITHVIIAVDDETIVEAARSTDNGITIEVECPWGTQAMATAMLSELQSYTYRPFEASDALINPALELGDTVSVSNVNYPVIGQTIYFDSLFASDVRAPSEEEIDHEYPYESKTSRVIERKVNSATSELRITVAGISSRVEDVEGTASEAQQTANKISWVVTGDTEASMQLTQNLLTLIAQGIDINGKVSFSDLSTEGRTEIIGDNIKAGTIEGVKFRSKELISPSVGIYRGVFIEDGKLSLLYGTESRDSANMAMNGTEGGTWTRYNYTRTYYKSLSSFSVSDMKTGTTAERTAASTPIVQAGDILPNKFSGTIAQLSASSDFAYLLTDNSRIYINFPSSVISSVSDSAIDTFFAQNNVNIKYPLQTPFPATQQTYAEFYAGNSISDGSTIQAIETAGSSGYPPLNIRSSANGHLLIGAGSNNVADIYNENNQSVFEFKADVIKTPDGGWHDLTLQSAFANWSGQPTPKYKKFFDMVQVKGEVHVMSNTNNVGNEIGDTIAYLPTECCPPGRLEFVCHGSGRDLWLLTIDTYGSITASRYESNNVYTTPTTSNWLPFSVTYLV